MAIFVVESRLSKGAPGPQNCVCKEFTKAAQPDIESRLPWGTVGPWMQVLLQATVSSFSVGKRNTHTTVRVDRTSEEALTAAVREKVKVKVKSTWHEKKGKIHSKRKRAGEVKQIYKGTTKMMQKHVSIYSIYVNGLMSCDLLQGQSGGHKDRWSNGMQTDANTQKTRFDNRCNHDNTFFCVLIINN